MRLILPHLDKERNVYGLKQKTLGRIYVQLLGLNPSSSDAIKLINFTVSILISFILHLEI